MYDRQSKLKLFFLALNIVIVLLFVSFFTFCKLDQVFGTDQRQIAQQQGTDTTQLSEETVIPETVAEVSDFSDIPEYSGNPYIIINDNKPLFTAADMTTESFERYSPLDELGRCGVAFANIGQDIMPTEERGSIGMVKPSGWHTIRYDHVDGKYLYNRCHMIGYQLSGENATVENLITGTRYMNMEGMLPFENEIAEYVEKTNNHVLYRVTPVFEGDDLLAKGLIMEAMSVEDNGSGLMFHVFCYNVQPGIEIDYSNGESRLTGEVSVSDDTAVTENTEKAQKYVCNKNTGKFHIPTCDSAFEIKLKNRKEFTGSREELIEQGYVPCKRCEP